MSSNNIKEMVIKSQNVHNALKLYCYT